MQQALWAALREDGHEVIRPEDLQIRTPMSAEDMTRFARLAAPDVIMCPFLKEVVPPEVCERTTTWIPHPGIRGDRGPSSLSWAILEGERRWGLTMVRAEPASAPEELDGGNVGAWREFAMPAEATLGEVYAQHVVPAAIDCAREILARMAIDPAYRGVPLADFGRAAAGRHRPALRQDRLAFAWDDHPDRILRCVHAAPFGVRTELGGRPVNVYDAHPHDVTDARSRRLRTRTDRPGQLLAHRDGAVLVATGAGGAVWIGHAKVKPADGGRGLKLPAVHAVPAHLDGLRESSLHPDRQLHRGRTHQVIRYRREGRVGWIHAEPYNGAASTVFCGRLLDALCYAANQNTSAIALVGGQVAWSNGIHLGVIEAADDPRAEAWANIQGIDDVAEFIFNLPRGRHLPKPQTTIAVLNSSAGAGGAVLSACFDVVLARPSINLNYHYGAIGLSGSELRSLVLPLRAGEQAAEQLLTDRLPISPMAAQRLGLVDGIGPDNPVAFDGWAREVAARVADRAPKALPLVDPTPYRERELADMWHDIFQDRHGFQARRRRFLGVAA
ncbi:MAG TPA: enoyl-CoA hydratase-related protein [Actinomycetes bacterium]|nr:enoyl-CoA hydratase-related protein [Actinomycetes bacterium]